MNKNKSKMLHKIINKLGIYGSLSGLLISSIATIPTLANAQERACVIADSGKKVCGKLVRERDNDTDEDRASAPSGSVVTLAYPNSEVAIKVQLQKCTRKSSIVNCKFSIVQSEPEKTDLYLVAATGSDVSQATDGRGEDYIARRITIGKSETASYIIITVVKNQPISVNLSFTIPPEVNKLKTLAFLIKPSGMSGNKSARFSNISISR